MRASLGGPSTFQVTVTVKNLTTELLRHVAVSGSVGRGEEDSVVSVPLADPGEIGPGQTRKQVVTVKIPAPTFGSLHWRVAASGAGPTVTVISTTRHRPLMLTVLAMILVLDVAFYLIRRRMRRRTAREAAQREDPIDIEVSEDPVLTAV